MYPALAVYEALKSKHPNVETLWVGGEGGMEEDLVKRAGIPFRSVPAAGVHGVGLRALPGNLAKLTRGVLESRRILKDFHPDVLFFTGGYVAGPMAIAGRNLPIVLYVPDIEPGLALKFLGYFSDVITVTAPDSKKFFSHPERIVHTGYPLRSGLSNWSREKAIAHFGLDASLPTLLVTGGSKGARSINMAVLKHLEVLLETAQIIHLTGSLDIQTAEQTAEKLSVDKRSRYHVMPYLHEMGAALSAADLVLSRAGASSIGEYPFFGLPAVLTPYPYAWRYQKVNADYLAEHNAAVILQDELLNDKLLPVISDLLANKNKRDAMQTAMKNLSQPLAADSIASQLVKLAGEETL
ncbi:MAG: UDP-N-acetylglucosamine--N-acetylmuramyl-(pentapeptide) pyrophosphoryl-undecaprenol N-acetylglucosamine transferase [Anaerolineales bacterium]|uniref:UDP-N-acetylglucosamine--N-acetylmuramyl- (pentapeptide) pyrophosphoryl-undecaprenol N-acetylglucosamine transferase n=1 Tax=Candidatus Villigracilis vicinus TaxID=3140679 RepID=UPI003137325B|nr:UDP-N-acetylglucosamine--N-acetylmuramyl-(pentapeptide) pyrophosphoryl-undecaprenol N-acetylglucosamine transferase [Anaerolineales bacterium]MBK7451282.1 UDP-N-acetylglucosamine--N-acetylmuramyl-(pentapeptide) pyrophosphoryl-undecaprenol N-acetylglucosamine transferase [Anaerolineales bacterium]MBK9779514.1 UDP-N-acetylglucosamine--N-acetylmuramyl-(pentapeptide) pyrophosphoryl-undecaprenol N-acetylglucosamine transferase [Anaerolineales bacterium]